MTWCFLGLNTCFWAISLGGVAALSRVYSGPSNNGQVIKPLFLPGIAIVRSYTGAISTVGGTLSGSISEVEEFQRLA